MAKTGYARVSSTGQSLDVQLTKLKENGVRFGRPAKVNEEMRAEIRAQRESGKTVGKIAKEFGVGEATVYRVLA